MKQKTGVIYQFLRFGYPGRTIVDEKGVQYIQKGKGPKKGVVAAVLKNGKISIGISLLSPKEPKYTYKPAECKGKNNKRILYSKAIPNYNWKQAVELAIKRAESGENKSPRISEFNEWQKIQFEEFEDRCHRYFKI